MTVSNFSQAVTGPHPSRAGATPVVWSPELGSALRELRGDKAVAAALSDPARLRCATAEARLAVHHAARAAAEAAARAYSMAEVLDDALAILAEATEAGRQRGPANAQPIGEALSPREREVLALIVEGRSNKAIAETLCVSPNTVKSHVASILNKLQAESRVQLAAMAARHGLGGMSGSWEPRPT